MSRMADAHSPDANQHRDAPDNWFFLLGNKYTVHFKSLVQIKKYELEGYYCRIV